MTLIDTLVGNADDARMNERQEYLTILRRNDRPLANDAQRIQQLMGILGLSMASVLADAEKVRKMDELKTKTANRPQLLSAYEMAVDVETKTVAKQRAIIQAANEGMRLASVERMRLERELSDIAQAETELANLEKRYPHLTAQGVNKKRTP